MRLFLSGLTIVVCALLSALPAMAACNQAQLAGNWIFTFQLRWSATNDIYTLMCPIKIGSNGFLKPSDCAQLNRPGNPGRVLWNQQPEGYFVLTSTCTVALKFPPGAYLNLVHDFYNGGATAQSMNSASVWLSADRQTMTGLLRSDTVSTYVTSTFTAMRRP